MESTTTIRSSFLLICFSSLEWRGTASTQRSADNPPSAGLVRRLKKCVRMNPPQKAVTSEQRRTPDGISHNLPAPRRNNHDQDRSQVTGMELLTLEALKSRGSIWN